MRIKVDTPEIALLRAEICAKAGFTPAVHSQFVRLAAVIETDLRLHLSSTTLERLWKYSTRSYDTVYEHTLDILCQWLGDDSWQAFVRRQRSGQGMSASVNTTLGKASSSEDSADGAIATSTLQTGTRLRLGWRPDCLCEIQHLGDCRFVCTASQNTGLKPGDTFVCTRVEPGRPLTLDHFFRPADSELAITLARKNGLTKIGVV